MKQLLLLACLLTCLVVPAGAAEEYPLGPDSQRQAGVPQGAVAKYTWTSKLFPGTVRDYWVYVPAQYTPEKPACVMVFQDGHSYVSEDGRARIPIVFDNLIAQHDMPVTIAVLIDPGVFKAASPSQRERSNRSYEYDGLSDRYAQFLLNEILPDVAKHYNLSTNPNDRAISGGSSGGICSFTVAWTHPEAFRRVLSFIGSYTDLRGGDIYPALIRKTEPKPLRVFLQDGNHDLNNFAGDWWLANQSMASALTFAGYDVKFVTGDKNHDMIQGGAIMPDALRWLWRDYPQPIAKPAMRALGDPKTGFQGVDSEWELVSDGGKIPHKTEAGIIDLYDVVFSPLPQRSASGIIADPKGQVYVSDQSANSIYRIDLDGHVSKFAQDEASPNGLGFGPHGELYVCEMKTGRIVSYPEGGKKSIRADVGGCQDLAVTRAGGIYFTGGQSLGYLPPSGSKPIVSPDNGELAYQRISASNGIILSPDESTAYVTDLRGKWVWAFQIHGNGTLADGEPFFRMETPDDSSDSSAAGLAIDEHGLLYIATRLGIQICDQQGRVVAILNRPNGTGVFLDSASGIALAGAHHQYIYAVVGNKVFRRHLARRGD